MAPSFECRYVAKVEFLPYLRRRYGDDGYEGGYEGDGYEGGYDERAYGGYDGYGDGYGGAHRPSLAMIQQQARRCRSPARRAKPPAT